nr:hypothetical protein [Tanacetum cinerariifolium]
MCELACQIVQKKQEEKRIEDKKANARYWKIPACYDDDNDYNSAITPVLPTEEPIDSLSMGDKHLDTIPATKSDEVIKSSVEVLVPIPSESKGIPDTMCDVRLVNNPTPLEAKDHFEIVIKSNDDISSSDDDSLYNENIEYVEASPHDTRFAKRLLYDNSSPRPPEEIVSDNSDADLESFSPSPIPVEDKIDLPFTPDDPMPPCIEDDDYDSGRDILILEELLDNYSLSLPTNESYHFDIPSPYRPPAKLPDGNTGTLNIKMMGDVSDQKVPIPGLTITRVLNQEKSPDLLSHLGFKAFQPSAECPMIINEKNIPLLDVSLFHFYPP